MMAGKAQVGLTSLIMPAFIKVISNPCATPTKVSMRAVKQYRLLSCYVSFVWIILYFFFHGFLAQQPRHHFMLMSLAEACCILQC